MNLCRCENGHFYNKEKYNCCPRCMGIKKIHDSEEDEDTINPFDESKNIIEKDRNFDEKPVVISDDEYDSVRTEFFSDDEYDSVKPKLPLFDHDDNTGGQYWNSADYVIKDNDYIVQMEYVSAKIFRNRAKIVKRGSFEPKNERTNVFIELNDSIKKVDVKTSKGLICYSKSKVRCRKIKDDLLTDKELAERQKQNNLYRKYEFIKKMQKNIFEYDSKDKNLREYDEIKKLYENLLDEENQIIDSINKLARNENDEADCAKKRNKYAGKKMLKLDMVAEPGKEYFIEIEYETFGISWEPYYKIDVKSDSQYAIMTMFAKINNINFNQRLDNIKITLSSGINTYEDNILDNVLDIQYIKKKYNSKNAEDMSIGNGLTMCMNDSGVSSYSSDEIRNRRMETASQDDMFGMNPMMVKENNSEILHEFELPWKMTLLPNGDNEVAVWQKKIEVYKNYFAIPKRGQSEYFSVDFKGLKEYDLISGWIDIYLDSDYVRRYFMDVSKAENLKIDMGKVKGVKINSRKVIDEESTKRLQGKIIRRYKYIFEIINNLQCTISLRLYDQIPISQVESVEVMLNRIDGVEIDEVIGRCKWNVKVEPLSVKEVVFEYAISYPIKEEFVIE